MTLIEPNNCVVKQLTSVTETLLPDVILTVCVPSTEDAAVAGAQPAAAKEAAPKKEAPPKDAKGAKKGKFTNNIKL